MKIAHLTSVHPRYDTRIFLKECVSLAKAGYSVTLIVADGRGNETAQGVHIQDAGKANGRLDRMWNATRRVFRLALASGAEIFHLHDPELIPIGLKLKRRGKIVIFDAHEDLPKQIQSKPYLNSISKYFVTRAISRYERWALSKIDFVITATPAICEKFAKMGLATEAVNNFPLLGELGSPSQWSGKRNEVCYVGGITRVRGIAQVVRALAQTTSEVQLQLAGAFADRNLESECKQEAGWIKVDALGFVDRQGVANILARSVAGIVTFLPAPNHIDSQPNKMFEYMSAGIPVISSSFNLWRQIIEGNSCGICVDPEDPSAIAAAIDYLIVNHSEAEEMGKNGLKAINDKYNWDVEEKTLLKIYERLTLSNGSKQVHTK